MVARAEREQQSETDRAPYREIDEGAQVQQRLPCGARLLARLLAPGILQRGIVDQTARPADFGHHLVAGIDAQCAGDAADLLPFADIDPRRAHRDALLAIDAIAEQVRIFRCLLDAAARLAAPVLVGRSEE